MSTQALKALEKAVQIAGGQSALARLCGPPVTQRHVWIWLNRGLRCPLEHAPAIEMGTGIRVEALAPNVRWLRDSNDRPTGYVVDLAA